MGNESNTVHISVTSNAEKMLKSREISLLDSAELSKIFTMAHRIESANPIVPRDWHSVNNGNWVLALEPNWVHTRVHCSVFGDGVGQ
jgi:hypothetical protein